MRRCASVAVVIGASLALAAPAFAADGDKSKGGSSSGGTSRDTSGGASSGSAGDSTAYGDRASADRVGGMKPVWAPWFEFNANAEYDSIWNHNGLIPKDSWNQLAFLFSGIVTPSPYDRILIRWGFTQHFITNQGEPSARPDALTLSYTRLIPLPGRVDLRIAARADFGTAFDNLLWDPMIVSPRLGISLERTFGPVKLYLLGYGQLWDQKYTSYGASMTGTTSPSDGSLATPKSRLATIAEATVTMPFHRPLSAGLSGYFASTWKNQVSGSCQLDFMGQPTGTVGPCPTVVDGMLGATQPVANDYGGEIFVKYAFPTVGGVAFDATFAAFNGDPTLGYQGLHHDGVARFGLFYTHTAGGYGAINVKY